MQHLFGLTILLRNTNMLITASVLGHKAIKACKKLDKVAHFSEKKSLSHTRIRSPPLNSMQTSEVLCQCALLKLIQ